MGLYRFKSRETGDVLMLHPHGKRVLEVLGKDPKAPGVVMPADLPGAVLALQEAAHEEELEQARQIAEAAAKGEVAPEFDQVTMRMRIAPLVEMFERCERAGVEVVWGV